MYFKSKVTLILIFLASSIYSYSQTSVYAWYFEGNKKTFREDYEGAIKDYTKAIELDANADYAYFNRGNAKLKLTDYKGARLDYNKTIMLNPEYAEAYYGRGYCKCYLGDKDGGCKDFKQSRKLGFKVASDAIKEQCK